MTKYRPEIDGLRTVAVLAVILFHLNSDFLIGGYYGVDVFFVISGYLITGILIKSIEAGTFKMSDFWLRRVKRIIPVLLTVIITTTVVLPFFIFRPSFNETLNDIMPAIFSYFNFHAYFNFGDYWGHKADQSFLLHTWSLSVEEQFYLLYPFVLVFIYKYFKSFLIPLIIITVISLGLFLFFVNITKPLTFYMLPFRIWELSIGGVIACLPKNSSRTKVYNALLPVFGLVLIFISYIFASKSISYIAILPVLGSCLLIHFSNGKDISGKILSSKLFVHIGKLSYSLYLWHWPVIVLFRNLEFQFLEFNKLYLYLIMVLITYVLSYLSFKFVESKSRQYDRTPRLVVLGIGVCIVLITFFRSSYFNIHYEPLYNQQTYYLRFYDLSATQIVPENDNPLAYNVIMPNRLNKFKDAYKKQGIINIVDNQDPKVLIIGDSHGVMWAKTLQEVSTELHVSSSVYTTNASRPFFNIKNLNNQESNQSFTKEERIDYAKSIISNINNWNISTVIISCRWQTLTNKGKVDFEDLISYLNDKDIKIIVINQPPQISIMNDVNAVQFISYLKILPKNGFNSLQLSQNSVIESNRFLIELQKKYSNIIIFDVFNKLYINGEAKITHNKDVLYFDDDHLSYSGTQLFKEDFKNVLSSCLKENSPY